MAVIAQKSRSNLTGKHCLSLSKPAGPPQPYSRRYPRPNEQPLTGRGICRSSHSVSRARVWSDCELGSGHTRTASSTTPQAPVRSCSHGVQTLTWERFYNRLM